MIDWDAVRRKVTAFGKGDPERSDAEVLAERAARFARASASSSRPAAALEVVLFHLGAERFGVEASLAIEVFRIGVLTPLPQAPPYVRGLTNRLGQILPVLDLAPLLGLAAIEGGDGVQCVVLGQDRRSDFGFLVSDVVGVALVPEGDLLPLPEGTGQGMARDFVRGVTSEALIVLDGERILEDPRLVVEIDS